MDRSYGLVQRKHMVHENVTSKEARSIDEILKSNDTIDNYTGPEGTKLTLMEELLLLGIKDKEGYPSFWNDTLSVGLRGSILIELGLCARIQLEPAGLRRKEFPLRKIILINETPTGDVLLDETIKHLKTADQPETVQNWISYLSGESWNPLKLKYQLKNVRERLAKNLVEKGILTTEKTSFLLYNMTTHPLLHSNVKIKLFKKIQDALLSKWVNDVNRIDKRIVALIVLAHFSNVLDKVFVSMNDYDFDLVSNRVEYLLKLNFEEESKKSNNSEVTWAVLAALIK